MSDEPAFRAMETRVHDVHEVYSSLLRESNDKLDMLRDWVRQLDEYEKKVDDLNTWIDGRLNTLESIGGVSAKFELEMESTKLQVFGQLLNKIDLLLVVYLQGRLSCS